MPKKIILSGGFIIRLGGFGDRVVAYICVMIEVFKTNVEHEADALQLLQVCARTFPQGAFNFDLDDCDRIFRAVSEKDISEEVISIFKQHCFTCEILP